MIAEDRHRGDLRRLVDRRVLEHDDCALAAELEADRLERVGGLRGDALAGHGAAGEHHLGDHVVIDQRRARHRAVARHDVDDARRNAGLGAQLAEEHHREAGLLGRLHHHGVAGRDRRGDLPHRLQQRIVPGDDAADDAERLAQRHVDVGAGHRNGVALDLGRHAGEIFQRVDRGHRVDCLGIADRLAGVERLELGKLRPVGLDELRELHQQLGAGGAGLLLPGRDRRRARRAQPRSISSSSHSAR